MCGIVSYIGKKNAAEILLQGLKSLEYRGYDSSGIAVYDKDNSIVLKKNQGKISDLEKLLNSIGSDFKPQLELNEIASQVFAESSCGIGHTRWATHGSPSTLNAHPHADSSGEIALVHNGIIKNYLELKQSLEKEGCEFQTDTDTEVITHLIAKFRKLALAEKSANPDLEALKRTIAKLEGSYAIAVLVKNQDRKILVAKNESPLVIGIGTDENYVASDSSTVLQFTDKILKLKDKQIAVITEADVAVFDSEGKTVRAEIQQLKQTSSVLDKGTYKHFLLKEIHEQPAVISQMISAYENSTAADKNSIKAIAKNIDLSKGRINFVACGSAYHAALVGKYLIELWAKIPVEVSLASEFANSPVVVNEKDLVIGISQSGETADTLAAVRSAEQAGAQIMAITNKGDSAIADLAGANTYVTPAGMEISVASTKAFTSQVMSLYLFALALSQELETLSITETQEITKKIRELPHLIDQAIERSESYHDTFIKYSNYRDFLFLSRGVNFPIALEGALKLKELSYIHATGYAAGEMKHGPIAILDNKVPVLSIAISGKSELEKNIYQKTLHNAEEAKTRQSPSLVLACESNKEVQEIFDEVIYIPDVEQIFSAIVTAIPLQFLAYFIAEDLGKDVDQPRNLAKSVTVE